MPSLLGTALFGFVVAAAAVGAVPQDPTTSSKASSGAKACNNSPKLCGRRYNNITYLGAHDSSFLRDASTGNSVAGNQYVNATVALDAGVRLLQAQVHVENDELRLCHTSCSLLDAGPLANWLALIAKWMNANPNDVVTILLVNSDRAVARNLGAAFESAGLDKLAYKPSTPRATSDWPTLQSMIDANTRLVAFATDFDYSTSVPYLLPEFDIMFETPYEVTEASGFGCTLHRPNSANLGSAKNAIDNSHFLSLVNHFKYNRLLGSVVVPDVDALNVTNDPATKSPGNFGLHLQQCTSEWGTAPNFMLVDFFNVQNPIKAVDKMNGLDDITGRAVVRDQREPSSAAKTSNLVKGGLLVSAVTAFSLLM
ncbi:hypothetical protein V2A60_005047 [Cordyceps javanica]|uniref:Tat pathway signal sequence n=1 Tax=Cordyceps javanica TaxID=43265 RepID=A0A545W9T1_9HYPO|nr:tat pathway signal sequence [Cordyceps javanica]TQW10749.1 tat pathway signal sequence [Cordyceps javanica]